MGKHTPGPWKATKDPHGSSADYCIGMASDVARIDRVAVCSECDAALIATAPDMLEALETTAQNLRSWKATKPGIVTMDAWLAGIEDVIAKATGG